MFNKVCIFKYIKVFRFLANIKYFFLGEWILSVFAGFVIFAYMGNLAVETNQDIKDVVQAGNLLLDIFLK